MIKDKKNIVKRTLFKGPYVIFGLLGIAIIGLIIKLTITPSQWSKEIAVFDHLDEKPMVFNIKYPSSTFYGHKYIKLDTSRVKGNLLDTVITLSVINMSKNEIGIVSKGFFSGDLFPNEEQIIYKGTISGLDQYYYSNGSPYINHKNNDRKIAIKIFADESVTFSQPIRLYIFADADFTL